MGQNPVTNTNPTLVVNDITDIKVRQNFKNMVDYFQGNNQLLGFKFFDVQFSAAQSHYQIAHGLGLAPQDIICTKITGTGSVTMNFSLFTSTLMDLTVSGPCRIRFFAGTYWNSNTGNTDAAGASQTFSATGTSSAVQAISGTSIDWSLGQDFSKTLSANVTFTFANLTPGTIIVRLTNNSNNWTVTWPTVRWAGGVAPTMSTGLVSDVYTFYYDGSNMYGSAVQNMS